MTDWLTVPFFGDPVPRFAAVVRPSAYGLIPDGHGRLAVVRTPVGTYLPGGGQADAEAPELTLVREAREECGLAVRVGTWRRAAVEHVSSAAEQAHFEKRTTCPLRRASLWNSMTSLTYSRWRRCGIGPGNWR